MTRTHRRAQRPTVNTLANRLRQHAQGISGELAAVKLLVAHGFWLTRADFRSHFVEQYNAPGADRAEGPAWVMWDEAMIALACGRLVCSSGEASMLQIAAALATGGAFPASALTSLDRENLAHVLTATAQASGYPASQVVIR